VPTDKRQRQRDARLARQRELEQARKRKALRNRIIAGGVIAVVVVAVFVLANQGGSKKKKPPTASSTTVPSTATTTTPAAPAGAKLTGDTPCPKADGSSPRTVSFAKPPPMCVDPARTYTATIETDAGTMKATLDVKGAPKTANNFVVLADYHFFDGLTFHRVIPGFVLQGGDPEGTGAGGPGYKFADELPKAGQYKVGSLAMANSGADTNGSQFFVIVGPKGEALPPQYSLFGQVTEGVDVAKKIEADGTDSGTPTVVHKMTRVTITES